MNAQEAKLKTDAVRMNKVYDDISQFIKDWELVIASAVNDGEYIVKLELPYVVYDGVDSRKWVEVSLGFLSKEKGYSLMTSHGHGLLHVRIEWDHA